MGLRVIRGAVMALVPLAVLCLGVTALFTSVFVNAEYASGQLPDDRFGLGHDQRRDFAATTVRALGPFGPGAGSSVGSGTDSLGTLRDLAFEDTGRPLYSARELAHLGDVATVSRAVGLAALLSTVAVVAGLAWLLRRPATRRHGWLALRDGGLATVGVAVLAALLALTAFDQLFAVMHAAFFAPGSFVFAPSDALIRLFPERLFADAAVLLGGWLLVAGAAMAAVGWRLSRRPPVAAPIAGSLASGHTTPASRTTPPR